VAVSFIGRGNPKKDEKYPKQIWNCFFVIFNKKKTLFVFVVIIFDEDQVSAVCDSDLLNCDLDFFTLE
jgi:hypothetical protein